jgi:hypothetical protein
LLTFSHYQPNGRKSYKLFTIFLIFFIIVVDTGTF